MAVYRIEFAKTKEGKFISHLDLLNAWERTFRRAELPLAFSQGFNPHPKISFASALAVGVTSDREYLDVEFKEDLDCNIVKEKIKNNLPPAIKINNCVLLEGKKPALMAVINAASYHVEVGLTNDYIMSDIEERLNEFIKLEAIMIEKISKKGKKSKKDIKNGIYEFSYHVNNNDLIEFDFNIQSGSEGNIRPEQVLIAIKEYTQIPLDIELVNIHRKNLYIIRDGKFQSPLE